ncbi:DUF3368 domain-containing protein [Archaeoglobus neptunius]|uniref:DUF3368 domain-containing protein n=1 Tax=Archaeoglobus neptunius TaxID=2798580 RepID=UPI001926D94C|nr:DUF3368 domain-containing protein [Archaeoglobus neptunius]
MQFLIPPSVRDELFKKERDCFSKMDFLIPEEVKDERLVKALSIIVDRGEAEAIALSLERNLVLLIDDLKGRKVAERMGVGHIGTLGLLKIAKNNGVIDEIKPYILKFLESGYYIDQRLIEKFLSDVGEAL